MYSNICYVIRSLKAAGAEKYVLDLASHLSEKGIRTHVISLGPIDARFIEQYDLKNVTVVATPVDKLLSIKTLKTILQLCQYIKINNITFIHLNMRLADIIGGIVAIFTKSTFISTQHDTQPWRYSHKLKDIIYKYTHRFLMKFASMIIAPSKSVRLYLFETEKIPLRKIKVVYHGIDLEKFRIKMKNLTDKIIIGSLARFRAEKGHKYIVKSLPIVLAKVKNKKIELQFAGAGPNENYIRTLAEKLGVSRNTTFLGEIFDAPRFLEKIDILVHAATSSEAFCYAALEGLAAGKPVVITNIDGVPEFIKDHYNGLLVPVRSEEAIARALIELITNPKIFRSISKNARISCRPFFSLERMINETYALCKTIAKNDHN